MSDPLWPQPALPPLPGDDLEFKKTAYAAEVELAKDVETRRRDDADAESDQVRLAFEADDKLEGTLLQNFHESIRGMAKTQAEGIQATAETVQKAAAALTGIYTALLGLLYAVGKVGVPPRAFLPALFLGAAVVLATAYVAYVRKTDPEELKVARGVPRAKAVTQTTTFVKWSRRRYLQRASYIRGAVLSLAFGLVLLPAPLLSTPQEGVTVATPTSPEWPAPPAESEGPAVDLFKAQLAEISALRTSSLAPQPPALHWIVEVVIWVLAVIFAVTVAAITWHPQFRDELD